MVKKKCAAFIFIIMLVCNIQAGNSVIMGILVSINDSLVCKNDTLLCNKHSFSHVVDSSKSKIIVTDSIDGDVYVVSDSIALRMLLSDTINVDSLLIKKDTLSVDSFINDSIDIPTISNNNIDTLSVDSLVNDSLNVDTLIVKKDSVCKVTVVSKIPESVKELERIYSNYWNNSLKDQDRWDDIYLSLSEITMNPIYYKYVVPLTYYSKSIIEASSIESWYPKDIIKSDSVIKHQMLMKGVPRVDNDVILSKKINRQLLEFYVQYPELVRYNESKLDSLEIIRFDDMNDYTQTPDIISIVQNNAGIAQVEESNLLVLKPNFWTNGGNGYLNFSQNYISDNWYKGGESTKSLLAGFTWQIKYDDKQKLQYEGKFEWKLGFITAPSDTVHTYKANNDLLRLSSKLGYKAIWNWYYTLSGEFQTQLMSNYETNSDKLISTFFSPATLNVGLGMDYKLKRDGIIDLSVLINPLNYTMYSVSSDKVDPTKFNIKEGHKKEHEIGSRINATMTWKIFPFLLWESKFSYTTNYEKVLSEWENTFNFVINKYLSTKLFVHARYDDSVKPNEGEGYFQLQELLSFGINYTW